MRAALVLLIVAIGFFLMLPGLPKAQQVQANGMQWHPPIPCIQLSASVPYNPYYPTATCQPTVGPYQYISPNPTQVPTTPPPASPSPPAASPTSLSFSGPTAAPQAVTITEPGYSGTWGISFTPTGVAQLGSVVANVFNVVPVAPGSTTATITDSYGQTAPPIPITVATTPPPPGPMVFTPPTVAPFSGPTAAATTIALSESNYGGSFTSTAAPAAIVNTSVVGSTLTISPTGSGNATVTVTGGQQGTLSVSVAPTPGSTAIPSPIFTAAQPYGGVNPSPVSTTFPQTSQITVAAVVKCNTTVNGSAIASFPNSWSFEAGPCPAVATTNPVASANSLHAYDYSNAQNIEPTNGLQAGSTYYVAFTQTASTGMSFIVCPAPTWTCNAPTTLAYTANPLGTGTNPSFIGVAADGISRQFSGDIWGLSLWSSPLTASQIQTLAYQSISDPYASPTPGPLTASPASIALPAPTAAATFTANDPNFTGTLTASPTPAACFSAAVTGSGASETVTVTGNGTLGTCGVTIADSGYNALTVPVTVSPTPVGTPAASYTNAIPTTPFPISLPTMPQAASETIVAAVNCLQITTTGSSVISSATSFNMGAGLCNSSAVDPTNGTGGHGWDAVGAHQAQFTTPAAAYGVTINNGFPLGQWLLGMSIDGANVNAFSCPLPYVAGRCVENSIPDVSTWPAGTVQGYIGVASDGSSRNANGNLHIWNVQVIPTAIPLAQFQAIAAQTVSDPYPTPTATATSTATPPPLPQLVYSGYYTGNTPFHHSVQAMETHGDAAVLAAAGSTMVTNVLNEGIEGYQPAAQSGGSGPIYVYPASPTTTATYTFICTYLGYGACNWNNQTINFPTTNTALAQNWSGGTTDHHVQSFDIKNQREVDGEGFGPYNLAPGGCNISSGQMQCGFGGEYPFTSSGLAHDQDNNSSGNAAGYAWGLVEVTQADVANLQIGVPIYHALSIETTCEAPSGTATGGVYPARTGYKSDVPCSSNTYTQYGDMLHIISSFSIPAGASIICKGVLQALKTFGGYTVDNNNCCGLHVTFEPPYALTNEGVSDANNIWYTTYYPQIAAVSAEGSGTNENFSFKSCLNYVSASNVEIVQLSGNSTNLPTYYGYGDPRN